MNQVQKNYLVKRVEQIGKEKSLELKYPTPIYPYIPISDTDLLKLIKAKISDIKVNSYFPESTSNCLWFQYKEIFQQKSYEKVHTQYKKGVEIIDVKRNKVRKRVQEIKDEIMIGNEKKAMELLSKFEKEQF